MESIKRGRQAFARRPAQQFHAHSILAPNRPPPPYGKALADRLQYLNLPLFVVVCVGADCWERAREWQSAPNDTLVFVLDDPHPEQFTWPVRCCIVTVEVGHGPSADLIERLAARLFDSGAAGVVATTPEGDDSRIFNPPGVQHAAA